MTPKPFQSQPKWLKPFEKLSLAIERPVNRLIGNTQLNPFYQTGPISVFLLGVVGITGFYLFLFYQYGFEASYNAVATRIEAPLIARIVRAIHRYASGALVITTLLHAFRILFMARFRGPRWLAWLTGIVMTFILWLAGITGYWLVWDNRAQLINDHFTAVLNQLAGLGERYQLLMLQAELNETSWQIVMVIFVVHVLLFLVTAFFFYLHIRHLSRPQWLPEMPWMVGALAVLFLISALFPAGMLPPYNPEQFPGLVQLDPIFLYYLPLVGTGWDNWLWGFMWLATFGFAVLPWVRRPRETAVPPVKIINENCTGCTKCARDCPYDALTMVPRDDDSGHQLIAIADPAKCVSCGICVGACDDFYAIEVEGVDPRTTQQKVAIQLEHAKQAFPDKQIKLIFTCQRHARNGAEPYLGETAVAVDENTAVSVIPLTCSGAIQPSLLPYALAQGATEVEVVGCPPYDCANRLGNMLEEQRVTNERVPRLRKRYDHVPITAAWLPPDQFESVVPLTAVDIIEEQPDYRATRTMFQWLSWQNFLIGGLLLTVVLLLQIWFTGLNFNPNPSPQNVVELTITDPWGHLLRTDGVRYFGVSELVQGDEITLRLDGDGEMIWSQTMPIDQFTAYPQMPIRLSLPLSPTTQQLRLYWVDNQTGFEHTLMAKAFELKAGQIARLHDLLVK